MKIPLEQIKLATNDFHDDFKIGRGGYGKVYKADLFHFDVQRYYKDNVYQRATQAELLGYQRRKSKVAIKRLDRRYGQGTAEFLQEISVLSYFRHQNLVTLLGFCDEDQERILVYEYASNGSLDEYISSTDNTKNYPWAQHLQICLDAARGLEFLHNGDEWEWEQKLPKDYKKIIRMSKFPVANTSRKKDLYSLLSSGILLHNDKLLFSISINGVTNEMVSSKMFSFKDVKWRSISKSRFPKVAKISDNLNLNIRIQIKPQLLTPGMMYGAYLVFKFCNRRKVSTQPLYVNLKYKMAGETLHAYFAKWRPGGEWLMVELFQFLNTNETVNCDILLESFCHYYCGNWGIFVEGLEFNAMASVEEYKENNKPSDEKNVERLLKPESYMDLAEQMVIDHEEIFKRSENSIQNVSKEEIWHMLLNGILIDNGEKIFSLSKVNWKKCHMLRAKAVICDALNEKFYRIKHQTQLRSCRFEDAVEILCYHEFRIKCEVETRMLSSDTSYACFLVFQLSEKYHGIKYPVKARDLLPYRKQRTNIISFTTQSTMNLSNIKWIPEQREDGWMEVRVWEITSDMHNEESIPMDLKLISFEGKFSDLIISGIEFRPI
ncbi:hypothetical protein M8C21_008701 [Ambrosia artemisiifolia]|uniref:Protein kinase domain-containing protein n=1 Tax=Ambrosia artemisiifolia TaxID=4212 RepID=A0AAD5GIB1_AMBAR|nr:hypothetical protein M8C21_008701 [Ambrosia artemisiifolia]